ncbi:hypothetical protein [Lentibacillus halodurans]|nr:hypothetical protein [Lentibacillus halodurans]
MDAKLKGSLVEEDIIEEKPFFRERISLKRKSMLFMFLSLLFFVVGCTSDETVENKSDLPEDIPNFVQASDFETIDWERKAVAFGESGIIGNENKSGVIGVDMPSLNGQKWMWHLWGVENVDLTVVGYHKETETVHQILKSGWTKSVAGANNGADSHMPSSAKVPKKGKWAMLLYTEEELFDILIYEINE